MEWGLIEEFLAKNFEIGQFFHKNERKCELFLSENHKKPCKTPPKPHGVSVKIPHPRGFSKSIPHPHGGWGWGPHGAPVGFGGGGKTLVMRFPQVFS